MARDEHAETVAICLGMLAEAFGRQASVPMIEAYRIGLAGLLPQQIKTAAAAALQSCKFMPSPAELRELSGVLRTSDRAEKAWLAFIEAVAKYGPYHTISFDDVAINAVVRSLGGWQAVCEVDGKEFESFLRARFLKSYEALARSGVGVEQAAPLQGFFDQENLKRGFPAQPVKLIATGLTPLPNAPLIGTSPTVGPQLAPRIDLPKIKSPHDRPGVNRLRGRQAADDH